MIELFDTERIDEIRYSLNNMRNSGVVTSTINGRNVGTVPSTGNYINYNTVVPQPFTHHMREGVRTAIENRVEELECIVEGQRLGLGALQTKVDRVETKVDRMDNDISEFYEFVDEIGTDIEDLRRQIRDLQEMLRIFPCRT